MKSFMNMPSAFDGMPVDIGVQLSRIDVSKGREQLYEHQLPELLIALSEQSRVESIRASNAIEGIEVGEGRAEKLAAEAARPRDRSEKEFAGYRDAIDEMMRAGKLEPPNVPYLLHLHRMLFSYTDARGGYVKTEDNVIGTRRGGVLVEIHFRPPPWQETEGLLLSLFTGYNEAVEKEEAHPLALLAALVLDLLAIHPVLDGNGRTARLLTAHELVRLGYGVARYSSVEQRIWETKNGYYQGLRDSQENWHEGKHTLWPWCRYLFGVIEERYDRFEQKVEAARDTHGLNKQERVKYWVENLAGAEFRTRDIRQALPGISDRTIYLALDELKKDRRIESSGPGAAAHWRKL